MIEKLAPQILEISETENLFYRKHIRVLKKVRKSVLLVLKNLPFLSNGRDHQLENGSKKSVEDMISTTKESEIFHLDNFTIWLIFLALTPNILDFKAWELALAGSIALSDATLVVLQRYERVLLSKKLKQKTDLNYL